MRVFRGVWHAQMLEYPFYLTLKEVGQQVQLIAVDVHGKQLDGGLIAEINIREGRILSIHRVLGVSPDIVDVPDDGHSHKIHDA